MYNDLVFSKGVIFYDLTLFFSFIKPILTNFEGKRSESLNILYADFPLRKICFLIRLVFQRFQWRIIMHEFKSATYLPLIISYSQLSQSN